MDSIFFLTGNDWVFIIQTDAGSAPTLPVFSEMKPRYQVAFLFMTFSLK